MRGINKVTLVGNLTRDPELNTTTGGTSVCKMGMATGRQWKDKDGQQKEDVEFHNVILWSGLGETAAKYLHKGSPVYIEGRLTTRKYTDKNGVEKYATEVVANEMVLLPDGNKHASGDAPAGAVNPTFVAPVEKGVKVVSMTATEDPIMKATASMSEMDDVFNI